MSKLASLPDIPKLIALLRTVAAEEIIPAFVRHTAASRKADGSLVTAVDVAVQRRIAAGLAARYPDIPLLGEEMAPDEQARLLGSGDTPVWCLDPLDGTTNFACGFPGFAISLALIRHGRCELGLVLDPLRDECFGATLGGGSWLDAGGAGLDAGGAESDAGGAESDAGGAGPDASDGRRVIAPFAPGPALGDCIAMIDVKRLAPTLLPGLLGPGSFRSHRNLGAVALEWCWLAAGRFQLYLHGGQRLWDYAAGRLIATEAGVPSILLNRETQTPDSSLGLDQRTAVAAANADLLALWRTRIAAVQ